MENNHLQSGNGDSASRHCLFLFITSESLNKDYWISPGSLWWLFFCKCFHCMRLLSPQRACLQLMLVQMWVFLHAWGVTPHDSKLRRARVILYANSSLHPKLLITLVTPCSVDHSDVISASLFPPVLRLVVVGDDVTLLNSVILSQMTLGFCLYVYKLTGRWITSEVIWLMNRSHQRRISVSHIWIVRSSESCQFDISLLSELLSIVVKQTFQTRDSKMLI